MTSTGSPQQYILKVTAGPNYDTNKHSDVAVNTSDATNISTPHLDASIHVRIKDYRGLPKGSPENSPYFFTEAHKNDRYAITFSFKPKRNINGNDLIFGNDFDHPIRDRLPPGFGAAFRFVKWMVDPGLEGDVYADEPYLYGPLLSSMNILRIGGKGPRKENKEVASTGEEIEILYEGADDEEGEKIREESGIPADAAGRKKHFLTEANRSDFEFEEGREYLFDFFNPYLDFNDLSLKLPVLTFNIIKHWDGQPLRDHALRYVLKDRSTNEPIFVIIFSLIPVEQTSQPDTSATASSADDASSSEESGSGNKKEEDNDDVD